MEGEKLSLSSKHCEVDVGEDRISNLPDNLIHEILSFIDMKYAIQTSVLSKRWKNIWMTLPFISLDWKSFVVDNFAYFEDQIDDISFMENLIRLHNRYIGFVNRVFGFRDESHIQIINLALAILDDTSVETLNGWILAAGKHNVQELTIDISCCANSAYEIPHQLLNSESLKRLGILFGHGPSSSRYTNILLPEAINLPQIMRLCLEGISISNLDLQRLFSSCPLMETLAIKQSDIQTNNQTIIIIDSHNLKFFELIDNWHTHLGSDDYYTSKICAPNLKAFSCSGFMNEGFSVENLSSLFSAQLEMRLREVETDETAETYSELSAEEKEVFAKRMMKFVAAVHNVQHLKLSSGFLEVLLQAPGTIYPQLCTLVNLKLEMRFTRGCLRSIAYLLKISPVLRILKLKSMESNLADVGDDWEVEFSLACMFSHLKFVEIREVEGCDNEFKFLRFLLKNSPVLEEVNLFFRSTVDSPSNGRQVRRFKRSLRVLPTASSNIQTNFI